MKKIIPKILAVVGIVCVLVACLVVPSSAYVGISNDDVSYASFMTPEGVILKKNGITNFYIPTNSFQRPSGSNRINYSYGEYRFGAVSDNSSDFSYVVTMIDSPSTESPYFNKITYNYGSYYVNLDWLRSIGAFDQDASGINAFYNRLTLTRGTYLGSLDTFVYGNEFSFTLPCYELNTTDQGEIPQLSFKDFVIVFVTRDVSSVDSGNEVYDLNRIKSGSGDSTSFTISVDGVSIYNGAVGENFDDTMVVDYLNRIMTNRSSYGLTSYNYKWSNSFGFNWRVWGNNIDSQNYTDLYSAVRFSVPKHTTPLPSQLTTDSQLDYDLVEYDIAIDPWDWLIQSASSFLGTPLFPDLVGSPTFGSLLLIFIVVPIIIAFLKLWVGG